MIIGGIILTGCSYFFVGPAQFIVDKRYTVFIISLIIELFSPPSLSLSLSPFPHVLSYLWITCISFGTIGIGVGFGIVPIFTDMLQIAQ